VKFICERCGKKYATAEDPAPGRVYKLKCKACGHLIVVKAPQGADAPAPTPAPATDDPRVDAAPPPVPPPPEAPEIQLEIGTPEPAPLSGAGEPASPPAFDATTKVSVANASMETPVGAPAGVPPEAYVDLFGDGSGAAHAKKPEEDPFLAAARASLPDGYGTGNSAAPDPFAPLREDYSQPAPAPKAAPYRSTTKMPVIPKPAQQKNTMLFLLIGGGALALVGILAFVLLSGKSPAPAPTPKPVVQTPVPLPPPPIAAAVPDPAPVAEPPPPPVTAATSKPTAEERRRARDEAREREAKAKADREARDREAREARERDRLDRERRAREDREARDRERREAAQREAERVAAANIPVAEAGLSQAQIERVLLSTKKAFDACMQQAKGTDVRLDGRRVVLRLNIQTSGAVTYPTIDDVPLNSTELGSCLKSAARLMVFPKFKGDTMHVEVPLVLR